MSPRKRSLRAPRLLLKFVSFLSHDDRQTSDGPSSSPRNNSKDAASASSSASSSLEQLAWSSVSSTPSSSFSWSSFRSSSFRSLPQGYRKIEEYGDDDGGCVVRAGESFRLGEKREKSNNRRTRTMSMATIQWQTASTKVKVACEQVFDAARKTSPHVSGLFQGNQILLHFTPASSFSASSANAIFPSSGLLQERHSC